MWTHRQGFVAAMPIPRALLLVLILGFASDSSGQDASYVDPFGLRESGDSKSSDSLIQTESPVLQSPRQPDYSNKSDCVLRPASNSRKHFKHLVFYKKFNFVYLHINLRNNLTFQRTKDVIAPNIWTWTFYGKDGALQFLNWPPEFGIWSMGLLNNYVADIPLDMEIASGNCDNITVGMKESNKVIGHALTQLTEALTNISEVFMETYGPSFFCYKQRLFINPPALYTLCKHIACPFMALEYRCCSYYYNMSLQRRTIVCNRKANLKFEYDPLWWISPMIIALVIFAYMPLLIMRMVAYKTMTTRVRPYKTEGENEYFEIETSSKFVFYDGENHITLFNSLFYPITNLMCKFQVLFSRVVRFIMPWLSLSLIGLQNYLNYKYIGDFILDTIESGTPMGFRSMLAGYHGSTRNFLPFLGGPYVALGFYIGISCIFIVFPKSLSDHLESGIPDNNMEPINSPLMLSLKQKEEFGSVEFQTDSGYKKIYKVTLAQFYMLLSKKYWSYAIGIQIRRWESHTNYASRVCMFPLYLLVCVLEHCLCIVFYGVPIVFLPIVITRSYYKCIIHIKHANTLGRVSLPVVMFLIVMLIWCVSLCLFMFCTIVIDACLFLSRIFIFTYTGIVIYPKVSYGYLIFVLTTIYYLSDCVKDFSITYTRLLKTTIKVCTRLQRANDTYPNVIKVGLYHGVRESILEHVIEKICPRRKQAFSSLLKLCLILGAIGFSLDLLRKTDGFRDLHVLIHVVTALFTCAVPRIGRLVFGTTERKLEQRIFEDRVRRVVCEEFSEHFSGIQYDRESGSE